MYCGIFSKPGGPRMGYSTEELEVKKLLENFLVSQDFGPIKEGVEKCLLACILNTPDNRYHLSVPPDKEYEMYITIQESDLEFIVVTEDYSVDFGYQADYETTENFWPDSPELIPNMDFSIFEIIPGTTKYELQCVDYISGFWKAYVGLVQNLWKLGYLTNLTKIPGIYVNDWHTAPIQDIETFYSAPSGNIELRIYHECGCFEICSIDYLYSSLYNKIKTDYEEKFKIT